MVNGHRREVRTESGVALRYVTRNHLGLKGIRSGCGLGLCVASLLLVDSPVACSCDTPLRAVQASRSSRWKGWEPKTSRIRYTGGLTAKLLQPIIRAAQ